MTTRPLRKLRFDYWRVLARIERQSFVHYQDPLFDARDRARKAYEKALRQEKAR